ncbi:MAG TPA: GDP-mannose 4,6-dehydratase [Candidatus Sulfomarinibacteraceae bacterium]|nr:GDP-mannose 4,6-dehydratase [Candidatus Sulfomarinibacteraceae bacterium]
MTRRVLVTGGAGFIGANYVERLVRRGEAVAVFDNLSRAGSRANLEWLRSELGAEAFELLPHDVRDAGALAHAARGADVIVHLAAQVAVTTSVADPRHDFEVNALGTFNVVEAARRSGRDPVVLYASTNKVYGELDGARVEEDATRYRLAEPAGGVAEGWPLDLHSPYGCSKGAGDQYVRDYHRIYGLPTVVFRQSCIYGPRQFGVEDQGWVAWFVISAVLGRPLTIYGDGKQVRDLLWVDDLLDAYDLAVERIDRAAGRVYNLGGGPDKSLSVWAEFGPLLEAVTGRRVEPAFDDWRPGDQKVFVSDISRAADELGWRPRVAPDEGVRRLAAWVADNRNLFG